MFRIVMDVLKIFVFLLSIVPFGYASDMLLDLRREHMFLNPTLNFVLKSPNFTKDNTICKKDGDLIFNWGKELDESDYGPDNTALTVQGTFFIEYKNSKDVVNRARFTKCVIYDIDTPEYVAQNMFDEIYAKFSRVWYKRWWTWFLSLFYTIRYRCPFEEYSDIMSPAHIKMERRKLEGFICNKWVKIEVKLFYKDKNDFKQLITYSIYVGSLKCPDESQSTGMWFWKSDNIYPPDSDVD